MPAKREPLGAPLAPPPSDVDEVLARGQAISELEALDTNFSGDAGDWTSQEARAARKNTVSHTSSPRITLYGLQGDDRTVNIEDLQSLVDPALEPAQRLYVRCPRCVHMANRGQHPFSGPNGCPARAAQKFMTCPICAMYGRNKRVYEGDALMANTDPAIEDDPNYEAPDLPDASTRREMLQNRLHLHMASFHAAEAESLYRIRREPNGNSFRIVRG